MAHLLRNLIFYKKFLYISILKEKEQKSIFAILSDQLKEVLVIILVIAALTSLFLGEYIDAVIIFIIVILNTILGFWQEFKSEKAIQALKKLTVPLVRVKRGGETRTISANFFHTQALSGSELLVCFAARGARLQLKPGASHFK